MHLDDAEVALSLTVFSVESVSNAGYLDLIIKHYYYFHFACSIRVQAPCACSKSRYDSTQMIDRWHNKRLRPLKVRNVHEQRLSEVLAQSSKEQTIPKEATGDER